MTKSHLEFEFTIGRCNGTMHMQVFVDNVMVSDYKEFNDNKFIVKYDITWPAQIKFCLANKNQNQDTTIDANGKIIADKYIKLERITMDRIDVGQAFIYSLILQTQKDNIKTPYWGFNGEVTICFDQDNSFMWHLKQIPYFQNTYSPTPLSSF